MTAMCAGAPRSQHKPAQPATRQVVLTGISGCSFVPVHVGVGNRADRLRLRFAAAPTASTQRTWFARPLDLFGSRGGYTYAEPRRQPRMDHPITANDLVDANGACPRIASPSAPAQAAGRSPAQLPRDTGALLSSGVALGMSECEVVTHLGRPSAVNLGRNPNGDAHRGADLQGRAAARASIVSPPAGSEEMDRVEGTASPCAGEGGPQRKSRARSHRPAPKPPRTNT